MKKAYNVLISRELKAEAFFKSEKVSQKTKEEWLPEFEKITIDLSMLMRQFKAYTGEEMKDNEVLHGFQ